MKGRASKADGRWGWWLNGEPQGSARAHDFARTTPRGLKPAIRNTWHGWIAFVVLVGISGCKEGKIPSTDALGVSKTARSEWVTLTVTATPAEADLSQHIHVHVEVVAKQGVTPVLENYGHQLTETERTYSYRVVRSDERVEKPTQDGTRRSHYIYELEFFLADRYELPAAKLTYGEPGGNQEKLEATAEVKSLETEPVPIVVKESAAARLSEEDLRHITVLEPWDLPQVWRRWGWAAMGILTVAAILAIYFHRRRRRRMEEVEPPIPAHEWAYGEFGRLIAEELVAKGFFQEYFYRTSGIVRGYIERRFQVSAPEMTTEEFLDAASEDFRFGPEHTGELNRFMVECDLVKYARHEPSSLECDSVLKAAKRFIEQTRERPFGPSPTAAPSGTGQGHDLAERGDRGVASAPGLSHGDSLRSVS